MNWRRRRRPTLRRSDIDVERGRLWSPDTPVNMPFVGPVGMSAEHPTVIVADRTVAWSTDGTVGPLPPHPTRIVIDLAGRYVWHPYTGWMPIDGHAGGAAAGYVLAREVAARQIDHAIAVRGPWPVGTRLAVEPPDRWERLPEAQLAICAAFVTYGAVCAERHDDGIVAVLVEWPPSASAHGNHPGPIYRAQGLATCVTRLGTAVYAPAVPPRRRRWWQHQAARSAE